VRCRDPHLQVVIIRRLSFAQSSSALSEGMGEFHSLDRSEQMMNTNGSGDFDSFDVVDPVDGKQQPTRRLRPRTDLDDVCGIVITCGKSKKSSGRTDEHKETDLHETLGPPLSISPPLLRQSASPVLEAERYPSDTLMCQHKDSFALDCPVNKTYSVSTGEAAPLARFQDPSIEANGRVKLAGAAPKKTKKTSSEIKDKAKSTKDPVRQSRSVAFGDVEVREYVRIMSLEPACADGPSIGIGWHYNHFDRVKVDKWELIRPSESRKSKEHLTLSRPKREAMLKKLGYTRSEIACTIRQLKKLRHQRRQTVNNLVAARLEEAVESVTRRLRKVFFPPKESTSNHPKIPAADCIEF